LIGTIQPIEECARIAREHGVLFYTDAAQSVGKIATDVNRLGVDLLSIAGHKVYAPKGVGALFVRRGVTLEPIIHGAGHESGRRAGTESALLAVGLGTACELARDLV
jgi:cysteine desulfurase